jgi:hypothetical protein
MRPITDLKTADANPAMETTSSRDLARDKDAHDDVAPAPPLLLPTVDEHSTLIYGQGLVLDPRHPGP